MGSAGREGFSHRARFAEKKAPGARLMVVGKRRGFTHFKRRIPVDDPLSTRIGGTSLPLVRAKRLHGAAVIGKGTTIAREMRVSATHLGNSELIDIGWLEY